MQNHSRGVDHPAQAIARTLGDLIGNRNMHQCQLAFEACLGVEPVSNFLLEARQHRACRVR